MHPRKAWRLQFVAVAVCVFISVLMAGHSTAQQPAQNGEGARFVYLFGPTGTFLKLDSGTGALEAYWSLSRTEGLSALLPPCREGRVVDTGCNLLSGPLRVAGDTGRGYGVFPVKNSKTQTGADIQYQVVAFQLPELKVVASAPIPQVQAEPPSLLLAPDGQRVLVTYRDTKAEQQISEPSIVSIAETYDAKTLKSVSTMRESAALKDISALKAVVNTTFGPKAYFGDDHTIFEDLNVTTIAAGKMRKTYVNPLDKLTTDQRERMKGFEKIDSATQQPWLDFKSGDSAAGRTVVRVANAARTQAAYWTVDLRTGADTPIIVAPFGVDHLTTDGRVLLIQEARVAERAGSAGDLQMEPRFWSYDVATGKQVGQFESKALAGAASTHRLLCIAPSGQQAFFANGKEVSVVSLADGKIVAAVATRLLDAPMATCAFADR